MSNAPKDMLASEPKKPRRYEGESYKGRKCPKHKVKLVLEKEGWSCDCCGDFEPEYRCPKCEALYDAAFTKWFHKWGHIVAVSDYMIVENGKIRIPGDDLRYHLFLHGGKALKIGQWCKMNDKGFIVRTTKPVSPKMLVVG